MRPALLFGLLSGILFLGILLSILLPYCLRRDARYCCGVTPQCLRKLMLK